MAPIKKRNSIRAKAAASTSASSGSRPSNAHARLLNLVQADDDGTSGPIDTADGSNNNSDTPFSSFASSSKKDKRTIKHNALLSRLEKSASSGGVAKSRAKKPLKRGGRGTAARASAKNLAQLSALADALPELEGAEDEGSGNDEDDEWEAMDEDVELGTGSRTKAGAGKAKAKGLAKMVRVRKALPGDGGAAGAMVDTPGQGTAKMKMKTLKSRPGALRRKQLLERGEMDRFGRNLANMSVPAAANTAAAATGTSNTVAAQSTAVSSTKERWAALRGFIGQTLETNPQFGAGRR